MPDDMGVRWYRHGRALPLVSVAISFLGIAPACLIVYGLGHPVRWLLLIPGAVLLAAIAGWVRVAMRAGIGVTPEHLLIRSLTGRTRIVPWAQVTGFEGGKESPEGKNGGAVFVLTSDGERLQTAAYSPAGSSPAEVWQLLRALEDERLAWMPGAVITMPPPPPPPQPGQSGVIAVLADLGVFLFIALGALPLSFGLIGIGPGLRAAHGGGTVGYYIPQRQSTGKSAQWYGEFRLPDGAVTRRDTGIEDLSPENLHAGVPVAARDTGGPEGVYPRDDTGAWHYPASLLIAAAWFSATALVVTIRAGIRWRRRGRQFGHSKPARPASTGNRSG